MAILAILGSLFKPPCIDSLALMRALFSRWEANATRATTRRASTNSPSATAPIMAREIKTWNPITLFLRLAIASWKIFCPMKMIPPRASIEGTRLGIAELVSRNETIRISGIERIEESSWIWSFLNPDSLEGSSR